MSKPRFSFYLLLMILLAPILSWAGNSAYNYISASELEARLTGNQPVNIVDIQVEEEFAQHHIKGALPTYAYPVKNDLDRGKLDAVLDQLKTNEVPVVVVCPRGAGGATRTYDYLLQQGIAPDRLLILEKGQSGWTNTELTEQQ